MKLDPICHRFFVSAESSPTQNSNRRTVHLTDCGEAAKWYFLRVDIGDAPTTSLSQPLDRVELLTELATVKDVDYVSKGAASVRISGLVELW